MKRCPHCRNQTLQPTEYHNQEIDVCRRCAGLWFEAGEFEASLLDESATTPIEDLQSDPRQDTDLPCPDCGTAMQRHHLMDGFTLEVERCPQGHGTWIEKEELSEARTVHALQTPLSELNQPTSWKTWLFQFVTQMPVEYNMKPRNTPWVTGALILLNTLIFAAIYFYPTFEQLVYAGVMIPDEITRGEHLATLITSQFLHGSWMHLIGNMYFLWVTGDNLEDALGPLRFILVYLGCGAIAALAQVLVDPSSTIPVVGASGAIAGLFGLYLLWFRKASLTLMIFVYQKKVAPWVFFLVWVAFNLIGMASGAQGVAYMAHIGGLIAGLILGAVLQGWVRQRYPLLQLLSSDRIAPTR